MEVDLSLILAQLQDSCLRRLEFIWHLIVQIVFPLYRVAHRGQEMVSKANSRRIISARLALQGVLHKACS